MLAGMSTMFRQPTGRERWTAVRIELAPVAATLVLLVLMTSEVPAWATPVLASLLFAIILATGIGWSLLGRWDIGCAFALVRLAATPVAIVGTVLIAPPFLEREAEPGRGQAIGIILVLVAYFAPTLGSPLALIWALRRESRIRDELP